MHQQQTHYKTKTTFIRVSRANQRVPGRRKDGVDEKQINILQNYFTSNRFDPWLSKRIFCVIITHSPMTTERQTHRIIIQTKRRVFVFLGDASEMFCCTTSKTQTDDVMLGFGTVSLCIVVCLCDISMVTLTNFITHIYVDWFNGIPGEPNNSFSLMIMVFGRSQTLYLMHSFVDCNLIFPKTETRARRIDGDSEIIKGENWIKKPFSVRKQNEQSIYGAFFYIYSIFRNRLAVIFCCLFVTEWSWNCVKRVFVTAYWIYCYRFDLLINLGQNLICWLHLNIPFVYFGNAVWISFEEGECVSLGWDSMWNVKNLNLPE